MHMHIVTTHKNTDFDALASVIAGTLFYPGAVGVIPSSVNRNVDQFLSTHKSAFNLIGPEDVDFEAINRLTVVDTNHWYRLDRMEKLRGRDGLHIDLWDHHMTTRGDISGDLEYREQIGATISLFMREMPQEHLRNLSPLESTVFLIGLYEDTGHLTFPTTTPDDARAAALLLEHGADLNVARFFLNPPYEKGQKDAFFKMMQATRRITIHGHSVGFHRISMRSKVPELAEVVSLCRQVMGVEAIFGIYDLGNYHTIIGRSTVEAIDIGKILGELGGGGHPGAGSASVKNESTTPKESEKNIESLLLHNTASQITIASIMSSPVISVPPDTTMEKVKRIMDKQGVRGLPVMEGKRICGIIVLSDLKRVKKTKQWQAPVKAFMTRDITTTTPDASPMQVARIIIDREIGYLPVIEKGEVLGIVSRTDLLGWFYHMQPESLATELKKNAVPSLT
ncbi:MAG: CBS domain-containing protein [Desulforhopalus sp.]|nr:CBS domain-containing protein [Desulforhopalus sp.]